MLHTKDIQNLDELQAFFKKPQKAIDIMVHHLEYFHFNKLSKSFDSIKSKGASVSQLLQVLICLPFIHKASIYALLRSGMASLSEARKDAYYDLKNHVGINWRDFLDKFVSRFNKTIEENTACDDNEGVKCLIIDDSDIEKRGKKIEKVSRVWNHVLQKAIFGFKLLTLGYYDGKSFIPINFSLHREKGNNKKIPFGLKKSALKKQFSKQRPKGSPSLERVQECDQSKIAIGIKMIRKASKRLDVDYLLMDSWFTCHDMISTALACNIHLVGMMRMGSNLYQIDENTTLNAKQIIALGSKVKRCRKHKLYYFTRRVHYKGNELQLFFCRQGKKGKWHLIVSTDMKITFLKALEIYQIRWTIEVFFKEAKQHLNLAGCQSNDFDGQISHLTICMVQYILLTLKKRIDDYETHGQLYDHLSEQFLEVTLWQRIWQLFLTTLIEVAQMFGVDPFDFVVELINHHQMQKLLMAYQYIDRSDQKNETDLI